MIKTILGFVFKKATEPSTWGSTGGMLAMLVYFNENREFGDYLQDNLLITFIILCFSIGIIMTEKGRK